MLVVEDSRQADLQVALVQARQIHFAAVEEAAFHMQVAVVQVQLEGNCLAVGSRREAHLAQGILVVAHLENLAVDKALDLVDFVGIRLD